MWHVPLLCLAKLKRSGVSPKIIKQCEGGNQSSIFLLYSLSTYLGLCTYCWILIAQHDVRNSWVYSILQSSPFIVLKLKMKHNAYWQTFLNLFIDRRSPSTSVDLSRCKWVHIMWGLGMLLMHLPFSLVIKYQSTVLNMLLFTSVCIFTSIKLHSVCCDFISLHKEFLNGAKKVL